MSDSLGELLPDAARALRRRWIAALAPWDLSPHHIRALRRIHELGTPRLSQVAEALRIAPRSATDVVDALERRGLVVREADPADRRATCVHLTDEGARVMAEIGAARRRESDAWFGRLTARQREDLAALLAVLLEDDR